MGSSSAPIITLTTDFGTRDGYIAAMKGVMLSICPQARLVDITHEITPYDVMEAAMVLRQSALFFPPDTIHLVVVDPGVGSERRSIALRQNQQYFVGPDNGIFSLVLDTSEPDDLVILNPAIVGIRNLPSRTFHGRDIFAPAAAHLANGKPLRELGEVAERLYTLHWAIPIDDSHGIRGWVVHIDHFGNCITNISRELLEHRAAGRTTKCYVGNTILHEVRGTYSEVTRGEPLMLVGSSDVLEISVNQGNAADLLQIQRGMPVNIVFSSPPAAQS